MHLIEHVISELPEQERYLLCFYATLDCCTALEQDEELWDSKQWKRVSLLEAQTHLKEIEAIGDVRWAHRGVLVKPSWYLYALKYLYKEHPEWAADFGLVGVSSDPKIRFVAQAVETGKLRATIDLNRMSELLYPALFDEALQAVVDGVLGAKFVKFVEDAVDWALHSDFVGELDVLQHLIDARKDRLDHDEYQRLCELASLYRYCATGEFKPYGSKSHYGLLLLSLRELHQQHYAEGLTLLQQALKKRNKGAEVKNIFDSSFFNYFMMAAYAQDSDIAHRNRTVDVAVRKDAISSYLSKNMPAYAVGKYLLNEKHVMDSGTLRTIYGNQDNYDERFYIACANFLSMFLEKPLEEAQLTDYVPSLAILRHEFQEQLDFDDAECERLNGLYGRPVLAPDHIVPAWEAVLNELAATAKGKEPSVAGAPKTIRLAYFTNGSSVSLREQTVLKSGRWNAGREISNYAYAQKRVESMDETDLKIWKATGGNLYRFETRNVLPFLVGSDRVCYGLRTSYLPVTVTEEKPYIIVEQKRRGFHISSNFEVRRSRSFFYDDDDDHESPNVCVVEKDPTHYVVIRVTEEQRVFFERLLGLRDLPASSESVLKRLLPVIAEKVEIHCPLLAGEQSLEMVKGSDVIVVQVLPLLDSEFSINLIARPLPEGRERCKPGEGQAVVIDEVEGKRFQVQRRLAAERDNRDELAAVMEEQTEKLGFSHADNGGNAWKLWQFELLCLMEYIGEHRDRFAVEWPEGEKLRLLPQPKKWSLRVRGHNGWFEVEGQVQLDETTTMDMAHLLNLVGQSTGVRFIRLNDGEFIRLTDKLRRQLERIEALSVESKDGHVVVPRVSAPLLAEAVGGEIPNVEVDKAVGKLCGDIEASYSLMPRVPRTLQATLRDYQEEGFRWMVRLDSWGAGACLADDMGLGKTVQTIALLLYKRKDGASLVIAPTSVVTNWRNELERFAPALHVTLLNEAAVDDRKRVVEQAKAGDVILTTYGLLSSDQQPLGDKEWNVACLDEAHTIKNRETKMAQAAHELKAKTRIALTGTPLQNHLGELWSLFNFINPGMLGSFEAFRRKFITPIEAGHKERQQQLRRIIMPFVLRRTKAEVVEELPDKTEAVRYVELSPEEMSVYELIRREAEEQLNSEDRVSVSILSEITRLRQAACAASLAQPGMSLESSKIQQFLELVDDISAAGNRILVFSQFTSFLKMVREALDEREIGYLYLDGATPMKKREQLVRQFQEGEMPIFIVSLKAGGLGLNLTGANYVIHLDPWWNPAIEQQATDRAYRIGQKQNVTVYHLISQHTIEEKILRLHKSKRDMADALLEGTDVSHRITLDELRELLA